MTDYPARRPERPPTHPGAILREDVLPHLNASVSQAAADLRVSRQTLHRLLSETTGVTPTMAVRLGRYCGNGAAFWLRLQDAHDLWHAERKLVEEIRHIPVPPDNPIHAEGA